MSKGKSRKMKKDNKIDNIFYEESKFKKVKNILVKIGSFLIKYEYKIWQIIYDFSLLFITFSFSILILSQINRLVEWYYLAIFTILFTVIIYMVLKRLEILKKGMQKA